MLKIGDESGVRFGPLGAIELIEEDFHFDFDLAFGMEVTAGITADVFDEVVKAFGEVGGAEVRTSGSGVVHEGEIGLGARIEVLSIGGIVWVEEEEKGLPFFTGGVERAGGTDILPGLVKGLIISRGKVSAGIA